MAGKILTHDELQHIEYCNKILKEHLEIVNQITNETKKAFDTYLSSIQEYVSIITACQVAFGRAAMEILKSARELRTVTAGSMELHNYAQAALKLDEALSNELITKIIKLTQMDGEKNDQ